MKPGYISTKEAAQISGYSKDYIGQICREGKVEAEFGRRSWQVNTQSLLQYANSEKWRTLETIRPARSSMARKIAGTVLVIAITAVSVLHRNDIVPFVRN